MPKCRFCYILIYSYIFLYILIYSYLLFTLPAVHAAISDSRSFSESFSFSQLPEISQVAFRRARRNSEKLASPDLAVAQTPNRRRDIDTSR